MKKSEMKRKMPITESAFFEIINFIGGRKAESGGLLFGSEDDWVIRKFVPDTNAQTTRASYTIDTDRMNPIVKKLWDEEELSLLGIIHSHPRGSKAPSSPDRYYFENLLGRIKRKNFYVPIVFTIPDGGFKFFPYVYQNNELELLSAQLEVVPDDYTQDKESTPKPEKDPQKETEKFPAPIINVEVFSIPTKLRFWDRVQNRFYSILPALMLAYIVCLFIYASLRLTPVIVDFIIKTLLP
ncbi:hypothetical protein GM418_14595 [Maribellus comscasis]|uniref:JAB domain-containing protein n=2 Tax=Maribellus comscasis TaxID=2681766 RepID=A0A6I6JR35_9BACT|nr:hypothetical protein GM418_14595 [Maribellus comscasis]